MKLENFLTLYKKINSKCIKDPIVRPETIKPLEENRQKILWHKPKQYILDLSFKTKEIKAKIKIWDLIKLKSVCTAKETINKMKSQPLKL